MRILYLTHPEADQGGYCLWNGLCEVLGVENVIDYPWKASYHGETDVYPSFYAGYNVGDTQWQRNGGEMGMTAPFEWTVARSAPKYSLDEIKDKLKQNYFDIVVCESPRTNVCSSLDLLTGLLPKIIVLHDSEDYDQIREELIKKYNIKLYLKREYFKKIDYVENNNNRCVVKSFPFSASVHKSFISGAVRDIDILCAVGDTNPVRKKIRSVVEKLGIDGWRVETGYYPWDEYMNKLSRSKLSIAPRGWAQDTLRRWDIPATGTLLLAEKTDIIEYFPLQNGVHCITYDTDGSDVEEKIISCLKMNKDQREQMALNGKNYVLTYNSNYARVRQLLEWINEL